jgi:hypothetical protein
MRMNLGPRLRRRADFVLIVLERVLSAVVVVGAVVAFMIPLPWWDAGGPLLPLLLRFEHLAAPLRLLLAFATAAFAVYRVALWWRSRAKHVVDPASYRSRPARCQPDLDFVIQRSHKEFGSDKLGGLSGRRRFMEAIDRANPHSFWIVEYRPELEGSSWKPIGYTSAIYERPPTFTDHVTGRKDQYAITEEEIVHACESVPPMVKPGIYVQAIVLEPEHRNTPASNAALFKGITKQLAALMRYTKSEEFYLLGEAASEDGFAIMIKHGFEDLSLLSPCGNALLLFDSESRKLTDSGRALVASIKRRRRGITSTAVASSAASAATIGALTVKHAG